MILSLADAPLNEELVDELIKIVTFRAGYNTAVVLLGTTFLGIAAGVVGSFMLLRKRTLMGDALAHATLPGVVLAFITWFLLFKSGAVLPVLLAGATISGVLGVVTVQLIVRYSRLTEDVAIGAVLSVFFGVGIVLLSYVQSVAGASPGGLNNFIYGQPAAMRAGEAATVGAIAVIVILATIACFKELRLVCFDERFGASVGLPVFAIDFLMMTMVVVVTVVGLQSVGLLLAVAVLIIPPAAARFWTERAPRMIAISGFIGGLSGFAGATTSAMVHDAPAGAIIVLFAGALFFLSAMVAPSRGVLVRTGANVALRARILREHILRSMFEIIEVRQGSVRAGVAVTVGEIARQRSWSLTPVYLGFFWLRLRGELAPAIATKGAVAFTRRGAIEAARITRRHRLWEAYLVTAADIPESHVDRAADMVEHVLTPELQAEVEADLARADPEHDLSRSIHPIKHARRRSNGRNGGASGGGAGNGAR